ncbi:MAG: DUF4397 domain-containing protein [Deltaproteobacteria bacterium]|nr:DUF4397 domain-containing protein [Deltaproteobacteria bacterium]
MCVNFDIIVKYIFKLGIVCLVGTVLFACSGSSNDEYYTGRVRIAHINPEIANLDIMLNDSDERIELTYGEVTDYMRYDEGSINFRVTRKGSPIPLISSTIRVDADEYSTVFITGTVKEADFVQDADSQIESTTGIAKIRFAAMYDVTNINKEDYDLYLLNPGSNINLMNPAVERIDFQDVTSYYEVDTGVVQVVLTKTETKEIVYDSGFVNLDDQKVYTFVLMERIGGGLPLEGMLINDAEL